MVRVSNQCATLYSNLEGELSHGHTLVVTHGHRFFFFSNVTTISLINKQFSPLSLLSVALILTHCLGLFYNDVHLARDDDFKHIFGSETLKSYESVVYRIEQWHHINKVMVLSPLQVRVSALREFIVVHLSHLTVGTSALVL